jgi:mono/diheme cytochrome c family protein
VAVYYANRGYTYEAQKKTKEATDDFLRALQFDPSLSEAMNALSRIEPGGAARIRTDELVHEGRQVAEKNCGQCHAIGMMDASREKNAPAFRNLSVRHQNLALRAPIERAIAVAHDIMPAFNLSSEERSTVSLRISTALCGDRSSFDYGRMSGRSEIYPGAHV